MDTLKPMLHIKNLKTGMLKKLAKSGKPLPLYFRYDKEFDALMFMFVRPEHTETIVYYVDDNVALLYEPGTKEIVGLQIEAFEKSFLPRHENVAKVWKLSEALKGEAPRDFGDMIVVFEEIKPKVAREIIRSTSPVLPRNITDLVPAFAAY